MTRNERIANYAARIRHIISAKSRWVEVKVSDAHTVEALFVTLDPRTEAAVRELLLAIEAETRGEKTNA